MEELGGVLGGGGDGHDGHAEGAEDAAEVEEEDAVAGEGDPGGVEECEVAEDEEDAELGGAEDALGELEAAEGVGCEVAFRREDEEGEEHGEGDGGVDECGAGEAEHEGDRAEDVYDVIDVEAVAGALLVADAGDGAVEAVA